MAWIPVRHCWRSTAAGSVALAFTLMAPRTAAASDESSPGQSAEDPWWGRDKALHFGVSGVLAATGYATSSLWFDEAWQRASVGAAFALTLGVSKELVDLAGYGQPSYKDMLFNVAGTALGVTLAYLVDLATGTDSEPERTRQQGLGLAPPLVVF